MTASIKARKVVILLLLGAYPAAGAAGVLEDIKSAGVEQQAPSVEVLRASLKNFQTAAPPGTKHETFPPTHQWILFQAAKIWSVPELSARLPAAWLDTVGNIEDYPLTYGARMEDDDSDMGQYVLCGGVPACNHFWDPAQGDNAGLYFLRQWDSGYIRAMKLWDEKVLPLYRAGKKDEAYYWLGRVAHILGDLSVPAHAHRDIHPFWESYEKYMVEGDQVAYNFKRYVGSGAPVEAASLRELFLSMARLAGEFDSAHVAGSLPENYVGHNGASETQGGGYAHYNVSYAECRRQADVLMPAAFRHMAGLYKLFWKQTHPQEVNQ